MRSQNMIRTGAVHTRTYIIWRPLRCFKNIVYIDENVTELSRFQTLHRSIDKIEADFQFAYDNLPETQDAVGRANKWAAAAYLAKTYMFEGTAKYPQAKTLLEAIMTSGKTPTGVKYGLTDKFCG